MQALPVPFQPKMRYTKMLLSATSVNTKAIFRAAIYKPIVCHIAGGNILATGNPGVWPVLKR